MVFVVTRIVMCYTGFCCFVSDFASLWFSYFITNCKPYCMQNILCRALLVFIKSDQCAFSPPPLTLWSWPPFTVILVHLEISQSSKWPSSPDRRHTFRAPEQHPKVCILYLFQCMKCFSNVDFPWMQWQADNTLHTRNYGDDTCTQRQEKIHLCKACQHVQSFTNQLRFYHYWCSISTWVILLPMVVPRFLEW